MEKEEVCIFFWNPNERNHGRIEISILDTSLQDLERNVEDVRKSAVIIKHSFYVHWSFKVDKDLDPAQGLEISDLGKKSVKKSIKKANFG